MNVKNIKRIIYFNTYLITFSYETYKGYYREQQRLIKGLNKEDAKIYFKEWAKKVRTMDNVQILSIEEIEKHTEEFEI